MPNRISVKTALNLALCTTLSTALLLTSACSSNPPEDPRYEHFGSGLPQAHTEASPAPYPVEPVLKETDDLNDHDQDGVINHRDDCHKEDQSTQTNNQGCAKSLSHLETLDLDVEFATNSSDIDPRYYPNIKTLAQLYKKNGNFVLLIEGHTDSKGTRSNNMKLSKARADAIAKVLVDKFGIDASKLLTAGFGPDKPIASNDTANGRKQNRRMVAHLLTRDRVIAKRYNVWTVELGESANSKASDKRVFEVVDS